MFGVDIKCTQCDFEFSTGWNHHLSGIMGLCLDCGTVILAHNNENSFSAEIKDVLKVKLYDDSRGWYFSDSEFVVRGSLINDNYGILYEFEETECPVCNSYNISFAPVEGISCPQCKSGKLIHNGNVIY